MTPPSNVGKGNLTYNVQTSYKAAFPSFKGYVGSAALGGKDAKNDSSFWPFAFLIALFS